jgi:hypothetical protein
MFKLYVRYTSIKSESIYKYFEAGNTFLKKSILRLGRLVYLYFAQNFTKSLFYCYTPNLIHFFLPLLFLSSNLTGNGPKRHCSSPTKDASARIRLRRGGHYRRGGGRSSSHSSSPHPPQPGYMLCSCSYLPLLADAVLRGSCHCYPFFSISSHYYKHTNLEHRFINVSTFFNQSVFKQYDTQIH